MSEKERFRAALEQALDRMETAFNHTKPDPTPDDREIVAQALWFGLEELRDVLERPVFEEPAILGCGCVVGTHDDSSEAMHEAHPEVLGWDVVGDPHLQIGIGPLDVERLGRALHDVYCRGNAPMHSESQHSAAAITAAYNADSR